MEELQQMMMVGETVHQVTVNEYSVTPGLTGAAGPANDMYYLLLHQVERERSNRVERSSTMVRHHSWRV